MIRGLRTPGRGTSAFVLMVDSGGETDLLTDTLLSHLSYEERELVEPLSRLRLLG